MAAAEIVADRCRRKALERLRAIKPVPYVPDRGAGAAGNPGIHRRLIRNRSIVWIADGVEAGHARDFASGLAALAA